jgi:hypothetical protein
MVGTGATLCRAGAREQFREFVTHRSVYHLREADPHLEPR